MRKVWQKITAWEKFDRGWENETLEKLYVDWEMETKDDENSRNSSLADFRKSCSSKMRKAKDRPAQRRKIPRGSYLMLR